jgi:hypothetical protein
MHFSIMSERAEKDRFERLDLDDVSLPQISRCP